MTHDSNFSSTHTEIHWLKSELWFHPIRTGTSWLQIIYVESAGLSMAWLLIKRKKKYPGDYINTWFLELLCGIKRPPSSQRRVMAAGRLQIIDLLSAHTGETCSHVTSGIFIAVLTIIWANTDQNTLPLLHCMHFSLTLNSLKELNNLVSNQKTLCPDHFFFRRKTTEFFRRANFMGGSSWIIHSISHINMKLKLYINDDIYM